MAIRESGGPVLDNQPFERIVEESPSHLLGKEDVEKAVSPPLATITNCLWEGRGTKKREICIQL